MSTRSALPIYLVLLLIVCLLSLRFGAVEVAWSDVFNITSETPNANTQVILDYRLPRTVAAIVIGSYLALSGLVFQTVLRNPLADPTMFGVSGGAAFAVVAAMSLAIYLFPVGESLQVATSYLPMAVVPVIALVGSLSATALVFWLAWDRGFSPLRLVLIGVVLAAVLNGIVMAMVLTLSETRTELAILWLAGSLYARDFSNVLPALPWGVAAISAIVILSPQLSALRFDPQTAASMGVATRTLAPVLLGIAACLAASAVSIAGPIGFVGLIVPHLARLIARPTIAAQILSCLFIGAILVVASDTVGRAVAAPLEVPVGIVTSLLGAPVFAFLIRAQAKRI
ncbi:iron complex transport system permease protein [Aliiroseovarius halocynthiae]|uniref:FecCD family ABC transporter permease n=1 Tax=Aliiroseovarius halocynthiae TaxID=985055 RepID=UPI00163D5801|nr:iron ABC transporter permease [Aliiroseovarius halocynthiae]SMR83535.1 iron complex transport system permease protein [Aliiroseovarius halocynthiae]